jgi:hypothetical protein
MHGDLNRVTPVGLDQGARISTIDKEDISLISVWCNNTAADGEIILSNDARVGARVIVVGVGVESAPWKPIGGWIVGKKRREQWSK